MSADTLDFPQEREDYKGGGNPPSNNIFAIAPYKWNGLYVFDKPEWDTVKEIFIPNATSYLEHVSNNAEKFVLLFCTNPFPGYTNFISLWKQDENGSTYIGDNGEELWLCNYLLRFYEEAPIKVYLQVIV